MRSALAMRRALPWALALWSAQASVAAPKAPAAPAALNADQAAFVKWAKSALVPLTTVQPSGSMGELRPLGAMVGDARIVALSEGVHAGAEPLEFRNRVFEYLVREKGFTAIAIESGIVEGRHVHDYVRDGTGELRSALTQGAAHRRTKR